MKLTRIKLGKYIEDINQRNTKESYGLDCVRGISTDKQFIKTKADMDGVSLTGYKIVPPGCFAFVGDTSRRGDKISLAFNSSNDHYLVSSISTVFKVKESERLSNDVPFPLNSDYLFMYFNRPEFDRYARFNSWGSARETFSFDDMCDIELELPPIQIQEKFANIYKNMLENQNAFANGLDDLKITFESEIEKLKKTEPKRKFIQYIEERTESNDSEKYSDLVGVGNDGFIEPRGERKGTTLHKCNVFYPKDFVYNPSVIMKGAIAFNDRFDKPMICTEEYVVFRVIDEANLLPEYLFMWLKRSETGRFMEFYFMDSVRNRVHFENLEAIEIPIPSLEIQKAIVALFRSYSEQKEISQNLKTLIKNICPILIKGSIEEANKAGM